MRRNGFKAGNRSNKREQEENAPEGGRLFKYNYAHYNGADSAYAGPYCICGANGKCLRGFVQ